MLDPAITLFGRRIQVKGDLEDEIIEVISPSNNNNIDSSDHIDDELDKEVAEEESTENDQRDDSMAEVMDESTNAPAMSESIDQTEKLMEVEKDGDAVEEENKSNDEKNSEQKQLKKPDKILPCPRCNSMDTKFCYYNNYNVNQPRHFCKSCQRYWTAGGTMRNVPVGAGRRKNKSSASRYCHLTVSEALQSARFDVANVVHHPGLQTNGTVLTFGPDNPFCEPVSPVVDKKVTKNRDDRSSGSTVTNCVVDDRLKKGVEEVKKPVDGFGNQMAPAAPPQCFQWPYMWNPAVPVPSPFCPSVFPVPIFHPPYWSGAPVPWNVPWGPQCSPGSNPSSPTLGKHTRDGEMVVTPTTSTTSAVLMPKTLRIDNPDEAAKSSIWSTLGIKKDKSDAQSKGFFNSFRPKEADNNDSQVDAPQAFIKANPVALCRSLSFQERA